MKRTAATLIQIFSVLIAYPQSKSDTTGVLRKVYTLGEVSISAKIDKNSVSSLEMQKYNARDVSNALRTMPSVIFSENAARNESTIYLRGYDIRSIPVYMDGIPVYIPYDGYVDLARFTTSDLAKIDVSKGYSSITYGANTIGGAINLIGMKPSGPLEVRARAGVMSGKGYETTLNVGGNPGRFYVQTGFSVLNRQFVPLSASFDTLNLQKSHRRENSYQKDLKGSVKVGYTPNTTDEYSINYIYSHGSKGNPVYLGNDRNTKVRYWQWPYWDKQSLYYISRTRTGKGSEFRIRTFYDQFRNKLSSFDDESYSTQNKGSSFNSLYDDYTLGGNIEFVNDLNKRNNLKFSGHFKNDNHSEHNEGEPVRHFADNTWSFGVEDIYKAGRRLRFIPGLSYNIRNSLRAENYNSTDRSITEYAANKNDALNAQLAAYFNLSKSVNLSFNVACKNRFATMKDRYSYRLGTAIPNPDLRSETAVNIELASTFNIGEKLNIRPELFYSHLRNTIQMVSNVEGDLSQMQNTGESEFKGIDLSMVYHPLPGFSIYSAYSLISRKNVSNPEILFTDVPENKLFVSVEYKIREIFSVNLFGEYDSKRNNASDGSRVSAGYFVLNGQFSYMFAHYFSAEVGVNNIFDRNYTVQEGYPEAGRNFYAAISFYFHKRPYDH